MRIPKQHAAFTFVELLVMIAILCILAAFLLPLLQRSVEQARQTVCVNNQLQIGEALQLYSDDNYGFLPPQWRGASAGIYPSWLHLVCTVYLGSTEVCYSCPTPKKPDAPRSTHYGYNWYNLGNRSGQTGFVRKAEVVHPRETIVFADSYGDANGYNSPLIYPTSYSTLATAVAMGVSQSMVDDRHNGGAILLFVDQHYQLVPWYDANRHAPGYTRWNIK